MKKFTTSKFFNVPINNFGRSIVLRNKLIYFLWLLVLQYVSTKNFCPEFIQKHLSHWSQTLPSAIPSDSYSLQMKHISSPSSSWLFSWHFSSDLFVSLQRLCKEKYSFKLGVIPFEEFFAYFTFIDWFGVPLEFTGWFYNFLWAWNFLKWKLKLHSFTGYCFKIASMVNFNWFYKLFYIIVVEYWEMSLLFCWWVKNITWANGTTL